MGVATTYNAAGSDLLLGRLMRGILRGLLGKTTATAENTKAIGDAGEARAAAYLSEAGLTVVERNFRVKGGEIDLICRHGEALVFVEVRLRSRSDYGGAAASITPTKQKRLILAARHWLQRHDPHGRHPCRFDCVLITGTQIEWLQDAFSAE